MESDKLDDGSQLDIILRGAVGDHCLERYETVKKALKASREIGDRALENCTEQEKDAVAKLLIDHAVITPLEGAEEVLHKMKDRISPALKSSVMNKLSQVIFVLSSKDGKQ